MSEIGRGRGIRINEKWARRHYLLFGALAFITDELDAEPEARDKWLEREFTLKFDRAIKGKPFRASDYEHKDTKMPFDEFTTPPGVVLYYRKWRLREGARIR